LEFCLAPWGSIQHRIMSFAAPTIYVDARSLQDPQYQSRGIGQHISSLFRNRTKTAAGKCHVVALVSSDLPPLPEVYRKLFDENSYCLNHSLPRKGSIFINASPMTHDPKFTLRFINHPNLVTASIVYDFIPLDWPGYLLQVSQRIDYLSKLTRLKSSTLFLSISRYSAQRLIELTGISPEDVQVTGASVRSSLFDLARTPQSSTASAGSRQPYFLTVGGADSRKNTETVVDAMREINRLSSTQIQLRIVGAYSLEQLAALQRLAAGQQFIEFFPDVDDRILAALYAGAIATIAPSYIEGFSLPVVEAAVCGSPVIASRCAAHLELIDQSEALFRADKPDELAQRLTQFLTDSNLRASLLRAQAPLADQFREEAVGSRFWSAIMERFERRFPPGGPAIGKRAKPKIAFLSPFPPEQSGVARFTELTLSAARKHFDIDLFTDAPRPLLLHDGVRDVGSINIHALLKSGYHSILSVLGNSRFHTSIFELFECYGGPCIMHDSRLTHIYLERLGEPKFLEWASKLLDRTVQMDEVRLWLGDRQLPSFFIEPVIERASPMIVHTRRYHHLLRERYGITAELATFPANFQFTQQELSERNRATVRQRLGMEEAAFVISSFGIVDHSKGIFACIVALDLLRSWKIPAELYFVGRAWGLKQELTRVATDFDVLDRVHFFDEFVSEEQYRNFMIACDAAVQLRAYDFGQPSAALADCISAGIPTVSNCSLAETCDAPSYVARIPDHISALLIAESSAEIWDRRQNRMAMAGERSAYCEQHSFEHYATRLTEILNL
jgi:glycosyltransferase involved in cell wall biosynthesis